MLTPTKFFKPLQYGRSLLSIMPLLRSLRRAPCTRKAYISEPKTSMKGIRGRSMIEMLAVLGIISILSAGGIWGYNQAMDAYTFNKFVKDSQSMVSASASAFPKPIPRHNKGISMTELHSTGVISDELYKSRDKNNLGNMNYIKNPFTGKIDWHIHLNNEWLYDCVLYAHINDNDRICVTHNDTTLWFQLRVPKKTCVKMLTYDWRNTAPVMTWVSNLTSEMAGLVFFAAPLPRHQAESICNKQNGESYYGNTASMNFLFFIHGKTRTFKRYGS